MDFVNYFNELNTSLTTLLNTLPFFHDSVTSWFVGIGVTLITINGCPPCLVLGGVGMFEYYKSGGEMVF
jgi:hypothetical protein|tara:strand:+ start:147 stop:353 length:207 start_codon:yes stop_codon:yes gene_type:complete